jgi:hypothetical protein
MIIGPQTNVFLKWNLSKGPHLRYHHSLKDPRPNGASIKLENGLNIATKLIPYHRSMAISEDHFLQFFTFAYVQRSDN